MLKKIFEPIQIKKMQLKNRLVVPAMVTHYCGPDGLATEAYVAYHEEKAKGGWGLIITEDYRIMPHTGASQNLPGLFSEAHIKSHRVLTDRVHGAGGKIVAQIYHAGREATRALYGIKPVAPSAIKDGQMTEMPQALTKNEIAEITKAFAHCAQAAKEAGFDGIELHGAHGYLINQFFSALTNKRHDEYGGSLLGRARFALEVVKAVREAVGQDYPIFFRLTTVEFAEGGLTIEETKVFAQLLEQAGVDVMNCTQGGLGGRENIIPPTCVPRANFVNNAAEIKKVVTIPVITVGRINDPFLAEEIIASDKADLVAMGRASIADPHLPNKVQAEEFEDIIYCIGCTQGCVGEKRWGRSVRCLVNPLTGRESQYDLSKAAISKKVFVVGGGLSGCTAAIIAARKGHQVTLFEKSADLGGQWLAAAMTIGRGEFTTLTIWQKTQLEKIGVEIRLNQPLVKDIICKQQPDVIIEATGSDPLIPPINGLETAQIVTAIDVLLGNVQVGQKVLIIGGGLVGAETAEFLAASGVRVELVEMQAQIAKDGEVHPNKFLFNNLAKFGVNIHRLAKVREVNKDRVILEKEGQELIVHDIDTLIIAAGSKPNDTLRVELEDFTGKVITVGDSASVKNALFNIQEGFEAGLSL